MKCPKCNIEIEYITCCGGERWFTCKPCRLEFYEDGCKVQNKYDLHIRLYKLEKEIVEISDKLNEIFSKMNEIYYAPDMPGYLSCKNDFEQKVKNTD